MKDLAKQYGEWLNSRLVQQVHEGVVEVSTPLLDNFNDGMRVFIENSGQQLTIHDAGLTLENLSLVGVDVKSEIRTKLIGQMLRTSGAELKGDRIQILADEANVSQRIHMLLVAMGRVGDLWLTSRSKNSNSFVEEVYELLDEKTVYIRDVSVAGKTIEHPIEIMIPLPNRGERLLKLVSSPNPNNAKVISFTWFDIMETRPNAERFVLINDVGKRDVSENTKSILTGYSTQVLMWSEKDRPEFSQLWEPRLVA